MGTGATLGTREGLLIRARSQPGGWLLGTGPLPLLHGGGFSSDEFILAAAALVVLLGLVGLGWRLLRGGREHL